MESPCMFNLSVLHVWFKTFGLNLPVCSICQYFMSGSKRLDGIALYIQLVCSSCLVQNLDGITVYVQLVLFKIWMESPCMFKLSIIHVWFKTFGWNHPVCSNCLFFMSGSKLLDGNTQYVQLVYFMSGSTFLDWTTLYLQIVSISCLVQHCWLIFAKPKIFVLKSNKRNICRKKSLVFSVCKVSN